MGTFLPIVTRQRGISIVESLVALVVMSIGLLGIAVLYVESVRSNRTALIRTHAVNLVNDLADRIRANRGGLNAYALALGTVPDETGMADCSTIDCTPEELARYDLVHWYRHMTETLPKSPAGDPPQAEVVFVPGNPNRYVVKVQWTEPGNPDPMSCQVEVQQAGTI